MQDKKIDVMLVAGTRPEVIKLSELVKALRNKEVGYKHALVYTGQHYSQNMRDIFFEELELMPDYDLATNTSDIETLRDVLLTFMREKDPRHVVVYGDTNSTLAAALAAEVDGRILTHIEAGIRSFDLRMPEERNRMRVDAISDYLLAPSELSRTFLGYEGNTGDVVVTGNLIVDVCRKFFGKVVEDLPPNIPESPREFILITVHRAENVDDESALNTLISEIEHIDQKAIFPVHPRTMNNLKRSGLSLPKHVRTIDPVGYLEFLALLKNCSLVMTDSGGVQEEAAILGKPCITLRHTTERWETLLIKANRLFPLILGQKPGKLNDFIKDALSQKVRWENPYGESVTQKVLEILDIITTGEKMDSMPQTRNTAAVVDCPNTMALSRIR